MKTLTEFAGLNLKNAAAKKQELVASGKTPEELPVAMGEALKLEGDRLNYLMAALDAVGEKTGDLKRVVVFTLAEGEKAPGGAVQKGEQYYLVERFPPIHKHGEGHPGKGGRDGKGRGDKRGKGRGKGRGGRGGERGPRVGERGGEREGRGGERGTGHPGERGGGGRPGGRGPRREGGPAQAPTGAKPAGGEKPAGTEHKPQE